MDAAKLDRYLQDVLARLRADGYNEWNMPTPDLGDVLVFHRRKAEFSKLSLVDSFCVISTRQHVTPDEFTVFSDAVYEFAITNKSWAPRGFGGMAVAHAVVITARPGLNLIETAKTYVPKHWASTEFPVLVDLARREIHHFSGTQLWGAAYYRGFRQAVEKLFAPS